MFGPLLTSVQLPGDGRGRVLPSSFQVMKDRMFGSLVVQAQLSFPHWRESGDRGYLYPKGEVWFAEEPKGWSGGGRGVHIRIVFIQYGYVKQKNLTIKDFCCLSAKHSSANPQF